MKVGRLPTTWQILQALTKMSPATKHIETWFDAWCVWSDVGDGGDVCFKVPLFLPYGRSGQAVTVLKISIAVMPGRTLWRESEVDQYAAIVGGDENAEWVLMTTNYVLTCR